MRAIFTFHSIDETGSVVSFPVRMFADLLESLARNSIPVSDLDELLSTGSDGIALTFDDGMESFYENALPILKEHSYPAHLFLTTRFVSRDNQWPGQPSAIPRFSMLDWHQIEACHKNGIIIDSHTVNHPDLRTLSAETLEEECSLADEMIRTRLGRAPEYFAYPYGYYDARVKKYIRNRYKAAVTTELRLLRGLEDPAALPRIDSYYLRSPHVYRRLDSTTFRGYLVLRNLARRLRAHKQNNPNAYSSY